VAPPPGLATPPRSEYEAIYQELVAAGLNDEARRNPHATEAVFKKLNVADEAETARRSAPRQFRSFGWVRRLTSMG
jgi:hypothetical protein